MLAVRASSGGSIGVEGLQLGNEPRRDVSCAWLPERLMQVLRGRRGAGGARSRSAASCSEEENFIILARDTEAAPALEPKYGITLGRVNPDLNHGFYSAASRHDRAKSRAPERAPEPRLERSVYDVAPHLPQRADEPLQLVALRRFGEQRVARSRSCPAQLRPHGASEGVVYR